MATRSLRTGLAIAAFFCLQAAAVASCHSANDAPADAAARADADPEEEDNPNEGRRGPTLADGAPWPRHPDGALVDLNPLTYPPDVGVEIDGGSECLFDAEPGTPTYEKRTCCNGTACRGRCILHHGESVPACNCVGIRGGCLADQRCCLGSRAGCIPLSEACEVHCK